MKTNGRVSLFPKWYTTEEIYKNTMQLRRMVSEAFSDPSGAGPNLRLAESRLRSNIEKAYSNYMQADYPRLSGASYRLVKACLAYDREFSHIPTLSGIR